jgi:hypothetical protein
MGVVLWGGTRDGDSDFLGFVQVFGGETFDGFIGCNLVGCGSVTYGCSWKVFFGLHGLGWVLQSMLVGWF